MVPTPPQIAIDTDANADNSLPTLSLVDLPLIGRSESRQKLHNAFQRVMNDTVSVSPSSSSSVEVVAVRGSSGTGKSALVDTLHTVCGPRCIFLSGKFDQHRGKNTKPFAALTEAFSHNHDDSGILTATLPSGSITKKLSLQAKTHTLPIAPSVYRSRTQSLPQYQNNIRSEDKARAQIEEGCDGTQSSSEPPSVHAEKNTSGPSRTTTDLNIHLHNPTIGATEIRREWAFEHLKREFCKQTMKLCATGAGVVLFLDDLQWADGPSLELIHALATLSSVRKLLIVTTFRDGEDDVNQDLTKFLTRLEADDIPVTDLCLGNLAIDDLAEIIAHATRQDGDKVTELAEVVHSKTGGNPLFSIQFLKLLQDENLLRYSTVSLRWQWTIDQIRAETACSDNIVDVMVAELRRLPRELQKILMVGSFIGYTFEAKIVALVIRRLILPGDSGCERISRSRAVKLVLDSLETAESKGFVARLSRGTSDSVYRFVHDRVQEGATELIPGADIRKTVVQNIGAVAKELWSDLGPGSSIIFLAADCLNDSSHDVKDKHEAMELIELAQLNLDASRQARESSAFYPAIAYAEAGIRLLPESNAWEDYYELSLGLYSLRAEMAFCTGDHDTSRTIGRLVLDKAKCMDDKLNAYMTCISSLGMKRKILEAIHLGFEVANKMGVFVPRGINVFFMLNKILRIRKLMKGRTDEDLLNQPPSCDKRSLFLGKLFGRLLMYARSVSRPDLMLPSCIYLTLLSVEKGTHRYTALGYATYTIILAKMGDTAEAHRFGFLAMAMAEKAQAPEVDTRTLMLVHMFANHLKRPIQESLEPFLRAHRLGCETGDIEGACYCAFLYSGIYIYSGLPLKVLSEDVRLVEQLCEQYDQQSMLVAVRMYRQFVVNLTKGAPDVAVLTGEVMEENEVLKKCDEYCIICVKQVTYLVRLLLDCVLGEFDEAMRVHKRMDGFTEDPTFYGSFLSMLLRGLAQFASRRGSKRQYSKGSRTLRIVEKRLKGGAVNYRVAALFLRAEKAAANRAAKYSFETVRCLYDETIKFARRTGFLHIEAMANERAGQYCLLHEDRRDQFWASNYICRAHDLYCEWGASTKVDLMQSQYMLLSLAANTGNLNQSLPGTGLRGRRQLQEEDLERHTTLDRVATATGLENTFSRTISVVPTVYSR